mmetsp:Transcript_25559/g.62163  ORF Transcript_25559/g.62163 Transcript_25559/m.62163 type:complete len:131 (-) Transcript_25559:905-1297(-)
MRDRTLSSMESRRLEAKRSLFVSTILRVRSLRATTSGRYDAIHKPVGLLALAYHRFQVLRDASEHGAAVLGVPSKATIKESADGQFVLRTIERSRLWEIQTPQVSSSYSHYRRKEPTVCHQSFARTGCQT